MALLHCLRLHCSSLPHHTAHLSFQSPEQSCQEALHQCMPAQEMQMAVVLRSSERMHLQQALQACTPGADAHHHRSRISQRAVCAHLYGDAHKPLTLEDVDGFFAGSGASGHGSKALW